MALQVCLQHTQQASSVLGGACQRLAKSVAPLKHVTKSFMVTQKRSLVPEALLKRVRAQHTAQVAARLKADLQPVHDEIQRLEQEQLRLKKADKEELAQIDRDVQAGVAQNREKLLNRIDSLKRELAAARASAMSTAKEELVQLSAEREQLVRKIAEQKDLLAQHKRQAAHRPPEPSPKRVKPTPYADELQKARDNLLSLQRNLRQYPQDPKELADLVRQEKEEIFQGLQEKEQKIHSVDEPQYKHQLQDILAHTSTIAKLAAPTNLEPAISAAITHLGSTLVSRNEHGLRTCTKEDLFQHLTECGIPADISTTAVDLLLSRKVLAVHGDNLTLTSDEREHICCVRLRGKNKYDDR